MKTSWIAAGAVVIVLALWMLSGLLTSDDTAQDEQATLDAEALMSVQVTQVQSTTVAREIELRGQVEPIRQVTIRAQTDGAVEQIFTPKGSRVETQQPLVKLDEGGRGNALAEASAAVKTARSEQAAAQSLQRQRLQSQLQLEQANASLEAALARLATVQLDIGYTTISAPFDGVINELPVEIGALIRDGDAIAELIDDSAFKVTASVSQHALAELKVGQSVTVTLVSGDSLSGTLSFIGSKANPQTRSFAVEANVQNTANAIAAGSSATISVPVEEVQATFITPSVMSLGSDGELGVKTLNDEDQVVFTPIELVSSSLDGAWVTGIASNARLITLGQGFVNVGERVSPSLASDS